MKKNNFFITTLYDLRERRHAPFMFMPRHMSFVDVCKAVYFEMSNHKERDMFVINHMLKEMVDRGLLRNNPAEYHYYALSTLRIHDIHLTTSDNLTFCRGTSTDESEAYAKAVGEVFERTSLRYNNEKDEYIDSYDELWAQGVSVVSVESFPKPTELQMKLSPQAIFSNKDTFSWAEVTSLLNNKRCYIPAQTIFFNNYEKYPHEKNILSPSSHGAGAGYTREKAISSGIYEVLNRHFFLQSWYTKEVKERIDTTTIPHTSKASILVTALEKQGFIVHLIDYSQEAGVPSVICILERDGGWSCGGTAGTQLESVIERSVMEAMASYLWRMRRFLSGGGNYEVQTVSQIANNFSDTMYGIPEQRVMLYGFSYFITHASTFSTFISGKKHPFSTLFDKKTGFDSKRHAVTLFGDVFVYDAQATYLEECNYYSTKVIIPKSYFFSLYEIHSRPVHSDIYPQNTGINPFP